MTVRKGRKGRGEKGVNKKERDGGERKRGVGHPHQVFRGPH